MIEIISEQEAKSQTQEAAYHAILALKNKQEH